MTLTSPRSSREPYDDTTNDWPGSPSAAHISQRLGIDELETVEMASVQEISSGSLPQKRIAVPGFLSYLDHVATLDTHLLPAVNERGASTTATLDALPDMIDADNVNDTPDIAALQTTPLASYIHYGSVPLPVETVAARTSTTETSIEPSPSAHNVLTVLHKSASPLLFARSPRSVLLLMALLVIVVFHAISNGSEQFMGPQGWAYVLSSGNTQNSILKTIKLPTASGTPGTHHTQPITPQQYIDTIVQHMSLDQELGQMMLIQFTGPDYSLDLETMIRQYNVGAVLIFAANQNIQSKEQLRGLIQQMQHDSSVPLVVSIDQEGGTVDRLVALDGPRPSATSIGATNNPQVAMQEGQQDAKDLASYGINLNLAPVVDVTNVYNSQLDQRTFGDNAALVTKMAGAYLQGLQQSGKVLGTLKHFPGLGDVGVDPHSGVPYLTRSQADLESIDWAPYRTLIAQGNVHAVMVTHEIVQAVDSSKPSSLSYKVVTGILRDDLHFQGVVITDSLTMEGILAYYDQSQAAALAVEAGCDLLMGAATPSDVASMIQGIKQAVNSGQISKQRIDDSVRRILMMKYEMGLLPVPG